MYISQFILEYIVSFAALIIILVFVHEFGHFLFARLCGVKVESFSIGFGKELFGFTDKKGTRWKIAPLPLGGYVKMKGEMIPTSKELDNDPDSFHNKKLWQKSLIVFAGPLFNLLLPIIVFFIIPFALGMPNLKPQVESILPTSAAYKVLKPNDIITKVNGNNIKSFQDLNAVISKLPNKKVVVNITRNDKPLTLKLKIGQKIENNKVMGFLGVKANEKASFTERHGLWQSIKISFNLYKNTISNILYGFKMLITSKISSNDIGGPVKIAQLSGDMIKNGLASWLFFLAALSINLAIVNLIPIPALDGGHLFLYLIQTIIRRPIPAKLQNILISCGFFILLTLIVLVTFNDILRLIK